jgi:hypothetical protein
MCNRRVIDEKIDTLILEINLENVCVIEFSKSFYNRTRKIYLFINKYIYLFIYLFIDLFTYLFIYLFFF